MATEALAGGLSIPNANGITHGGRVVLADTGSIAGSTASRGGSADLNQSARPGSKPFGKTESDSALDCQSPATHPDHAYDEDEDRQVEGSKNIFTNPQANLEPDPAALAAAHAFTFEHRLVFGRADCSIARYERSGL